MEDEIFWETDKLHLKIFSMILQTKIVPPPAAFQKSPICEVRTSQTPNYYFMPVCKVRGLKFKALENGSVRARMYCEVQGAAWCDYLGGHTGGGTFLAPQLKTLDFIS